MADATIKDEFDDAFAQFANPPAAGAGDPASDPAPPADPEPADPAPAAGDDVSADPVGADGGGDPAGGAADPAPAGDPDPVPAGPDATDELINRLASLVKEAPAQPQAPAAQSAPAEQEPDIYTPEETEFLSNYDKDWSDVTRGEALKRRKEHVDLVKYVFSQVAEQLRPILETVDVLSTRTHLSDLREKVNDYDTVRDNVVAWVETQPVYLQNAYKAVISQGTAEEVADLISRYKQETGVAQQPSAPAPAEPSDDARKAAQALAPVSTKRSVIPQQDDPNDFDAAFKRFATGGV